MKYIIIFIFGVFLSLFVLANYYIGLRGWQSLSPAFPWAIKEAYWIIFWAVAASYFLGRLGRKWLPGKISKVLTNIGAYWLAAMLYLLLAIIAIDVVIIISGMLGYVYPPLLLQAIGLAVILLVTVLLAYGFYNSRKVKITSYNISLAKELKNLNLKIVMISDLHLGEVVHKQRVSAMVEKINGLKPDMVMIAGDIVDDNLDYFFNNNMAE
ncbi:MAG: metallophosphoesterase, partial [Bacillota bacterium]|nr:metallophosphoesterase [Bacillota bacterium]